MPESNAAHSASCRLFPVYSDLSTNSDVTDTRGNSNDVLVYAEASKPAADTTPESSSMLLLGLGFSCLDMIGRKFRKS
jgi:hypothetical protein